MFGWGHDVAGLKNVLFGVLDRLGLQVDGFPNEGVAALGYWVRRSRAPAPSAPVFRGWPALEACLALDVATVLDVGSGGGEHASAFRDAGRQVTCVDFGTSVYAQRAVSPEGFEVLHGDFSAMAIAGVFDLVWCSHVLEHQPNAGLFLTKLHAVCAPTGWVCITLPVCHRALWGGHVSLWTPGLLAYNIALTGIDVSKARLIHGRREFSLLYRPIRATLPPLTYDAGDIAALSPLLPAWCQEGGDSW
jgi:SAM-dependent methyltransferase